MSRLSDCLGKVSVFLKKSGKDNPLSPAIQERMARDVERLTQKKVGEGLKESEAHLAAAKEIVGRHLSTTEGHLEAARKGLKDQEAYAKAQQPSKPPKATQTPKEASESPQGLSEQATHVSDLSGSELRRMANDKGKSDSEIEVEIFGEEKARKYRQLLRQENSFDSKKSDAASHELQKMEDELTEAQRKRLWGVGESDLPHETLKDLADTVERVENAADIDELAQILKFKITKLKENPELPSEIEALAAFKAAARTIKKNDWNPQEAQRKLVAEFAKRFSDPADAYDLLESTMGGIFKKQAKETLSRLESKKSSEDRPRSSRVPEQYTAKELGLPEKMSDKGSVHNRQIERALYENKPVHAGEAKRYGVELPKHYKVGGDGIARPEGRPEVQPSQLSASSAPISEPSKSVTQGHVNRVLETLRRTPIGRKLLRTVNFVPDGERITSHPDNAKRKFSDIDKRIIKQAQGFYDPQTGKTFVIRDNVEVRPGETPEQAVVRVLMHERVGHDGMGFMRANDPEFEKAYHDIAGQIPKEELKAIAKRYGYDPIQDRDCTIGEWFAQKVENLRPDELPDPQSAFGRMWQAIKDFINRLTGRQTATDQQIRDLASAIVHSHEALEPRTGAGEVEPTPSLATAKSEIEPSLKDMTDWAKDKAKDMKEMIEEGRKVKKFTPLRKAIGKLSSHFDEAFWENRDYQKEFKKAVPDKLAQRAIGAYIEAEGNTQVLQMHEQLSTGSAKDKYKKAQNLTPEQIKWADHISDLFEKDAAAGVKNGILDAASVKSGYLTKIWKQAVNPSKQKQFSGFATRLSKDSRFAKKSTWNNFFEGEQAGFTPLTDNPLELYPIYHMEMTKAIGTRKFIKDLTTLKASDGNPLAAPMGGSIDTGPSKPGDASLITNRIPSVQNQAGEDVNYRRLDNSALSKWKWVDKTSSGDDVLMNGELALHPEAYTHVKNMLARSAIKEWYESPSTTLGQSLAKKAVKVTDVLNSEVKGSMLSLTPFHATTEGTHALGHGVNPFSIEKIDPNNPEHRDAMEHTLSLGGGNSGQDQWMEGVRSSGIINKIPGIGDVNEKISDFLFHDFIPSLKIKTYRKMLEANLKRFEPEIKSGEVTVDDIKAMTAEHTNNSYGHLNYADMGSNPTIEHVMRLLLLAPDFLRARLGFAKQAIMGLGSKTGREQLKAFALLSGTVFGAARIINGLLNDGDTKAKEAPFGIVANGRIYTMRTVAEDIWKAFTEPRKFISGRLSPLISRTAMEALTGKDYRGMNISNKDIALDTLLQAVPISAKEIPWIKNLTTTGSQSPISPWEQLMGAVGIHANRYSPISQTYQKLNEWEKAQGKPDRGTEPVSRYAQLRYSLEDNDPEKAKAEWDKLVKKEHEQNPKIALSQLKENLAKGFHSSEMRGFADNAFDEKEFYKSLDAEGKAQFREATKLKSSIWKRFTRATQTGKSLSSEAKDRLSS